MKGLLLQQGFDFAYDKVLYEGVKHTALASLSTDVLTLTFNSLSKSYRACGYRAGWMVISGDKSVARDYIEGRRARYISPFALFLFTIFLTFLVFSFGSPAIEGDAVRVDGATIQVGAAAPEVGKAPAGPASADLSGAVGPDNLADFIRDAHASGVARISFFGIERIEKRANAALANPDLVFYKMKQKGYKLSFLLVPLSLPWLWLLFFWRREYRGYDHVVFLLYSISFMSLLVMAAVLLSMAGVTSGWIYAALLLGYPLVHMFLQLKGAYALTTGGALWRTAVLATAAAVTLVFYLLIVLLLGLID